MRRGVGKKLRDAIGRRSMGPGQAISVKEQNIANLYKTYEDSDNCLGYIDEDGIAQLGQDLGIDAQTDVSILVLLWRLGAKANGRISKEEFMTGMVDLGVDSLRGIKSLLPLLTPEILEYTEFKSFYRFVFQFSRDGLAKTIEKDIIIALLPMIMGNRSSHTNLFVKYLEQSTGNDRITFDEWNSFLEFTVTVQDLNEYSDEGAWPILLDEYVVWYNNNK